MSIKEDTAWPADLLSVFERHASCTTFQDHYSLACNALLRYCFGLERLDVCIAPGNPFSDARRSTHPIVYYVVYDVGPDEPIFLLEIKDDSCADVAALRCRADEQMRELYDEMLPKCPLPRLWGVSLLGTSMRVYCGHTASLTVNPPAVPYESDRTVPPSFLAGEWDLDIMSQEGFEKMKNVISDIKSDT
ncbi:hypothetical protein GSI_11955 [Ganoderma sinense ZZ0214-1]|uniref:Uncharacterized protein n=1 Tax=Ganoderma sinense ZZ0214-1 TaxID=1077348 RepID=A0A2G8RXF7_9APHY|nr:hypothetical protein GSI_11955 [Ganoderma sinense ZZ0214-1]